MSMSQSAGASSFSSLAAAAPALGLRGWQVLPCWPTGPKAKQPRTKHGHLDASSDPKVITVWWTRWPTAMIGGTQRKCGPVSISVAVARSWKPWRLCGSLPLQKPPGRAQFDPTSVRVEWR